MSTFDRRAREWVARPAAHRSRSRASRRLCGFLHPALVPAACGQRARRNWRRACRRHHLCGGARRGPCRDRTSASVKRRRSTCCHWSTAAPERAPHRRLLSRCFAKALCAVARLRRSPEPRSGLDSPPQEISHHARGMQRHACWARRVARGVPHACGLIVALRTRIPASRAIGSASACASSARGSPRARSSFSRWRCRFARGMPVLICSRYAPRKACAYWRLGDCIRPPRARSPGRGVRATARLAPPISHAEYEAGHAVDAGLLGGVRLGCSMRATSGPRSASLHADDDRGIRDRNRPPP